MNPEDLVIIDYTSLFDNEKALLASPPTPNSSIDSIDSGFGTGNNYPIKLNQAWEMEVKFKKTTFDLFKKMYQECERLRWINTIPVSSFHKV